MAFDFVMQLMKYCVHSKIGIFMAWGLWIVPMTMFSWVQFDFCQFQQIQIQIQNSI